MCERTLRCMNIEHWIKGTVFFSLFHLFVRSLFSTFPAFSLVRAIEFWPSFSINLVTHSISFVVVVTAFVFSFASQLLSSRTRKSLRKVQRRSKRRHICTSQRCTREVNQERASERRTTTNVSIKTQREEGKKHDANTLEIENVFQMHSSRKMWVSTDLTRSLACSLRPSLCLAQYLCV